jgi:hypothetical protein
MPAWLRCATLAVGKHDDDREQLRASDRCSSAQAGGGPRRLARVRSEIQKPNDSAMSRAPHIADQPHGKAAAVLTINVAARGGSASTALPKAIEEKEKVQYN